MEDVTCVKGSSAACVWPGGSTSQWHCLFRDYIELGFSILAKYNFSYSYRNTYAGIRYYERENMWCAYICIWVNMVSDIVTPQWPLSHHCTISTFSVWTDCMDLGWVSKLDLGGGFLRGFKLGRKKTCQAFVQGGLSVVRIVWFRRKFCLSVGYRDIWDDFGGVVKTLIE